MAERPGVANLVAALDVRRQARRGFGFGVALAVAVFAFFVAIPGAVRSPLFYVALGFVLAVSAGLLATTVLVLAAAYRLTRDLEGVDADLDAGEAPGSEDW